MEKAKLLRELEILENDNYKDEEKIKQIKLKIEDLGQKLNEKYKNLNDRLDYYNKLNYESDEELQLIDQNTLVPLDRLQLQVKNHLV